MKRMIAVAAVVLLAAPASASRQVEQAWSLWRAGMIDNAGSVAGTASRVPASMHLIALVGFVNGRYHQGLSTYRQLKAAYPRYAELDNPVVHAYLHLNRFDDALAFARERKLRNGTIEMLVMRAENPLKVALKRKTTIRFIKNRPPAAVDARLNGHRIVARLDTGESFLVMSPARAKALGVVLKESGRGFLPEETETVLHGIAAGFQIGKAKLGNVPVVARSGIDGDAVLFGTNVLEQFLSTLDFPRGRLILSPRRKPKAARSHIRSIKGDAVKIPFLLWDDRRLVAGGRAGTGRNLNFLVNFRSTEAAGAAPECLTAAAADFKRWGFSPGEGTFKSDLAVSVGEAELEGCLLSAKDGSSWPSCGGIRIDGEIGPGFLERYAWTVDFDRRVFVLSRPGR